MRILVITQYFWPENFRINDVCKGLKERGHEVVVLTGKPNYPQGKYFKGYSWFTKNIEIWDGITIYRSNLILRGKGKGIRLVLNYFSFSFFSTLNLFFLKHKFDKILIFAPSPILVGLPGIVASKLFNAKSFLWVHDLWPESIKVAGGIQNKFIIKLFDRITRYIYSNINIILIQSNGFLPYLKNQGVNKNKIIYYPFYAETFYKIQDAKLEFINKLPIGFKLMFAGNLGEGQSFPTLLMAAKYLKEKGLQIHWIIFGDGRMKNLIMDEIKKYNLVENFILMGSFPPEEMPNYFSCADALVVSLKKSYIFSITIPGKLQSYLACGKPIIGSLDGVGAEIIDNARAGFTGKAESVDDLVVAVERLYKTPIELRKNMGENARHYFENEFEREMLLSKLDLILAN
jgi:glycosyltransferase involved in cell wall biosynthesis